MADARTIETGTPFVTARVEDRVALITLNRPERRNALSPVMFDGLERALIDVETAEDVGCVVLTTCRSGSTRARPSASAW